jgi:hypothetical protein
LSIAKKLEVALTKRAFWVVSTLAVLFSIAANINKFFDYYIADVRKPISNQNVTTGNMTNLTQYYSYFQAYYTAFEYTTVNSALQVSEALFRDLVIVVILIPLNILILVELKQSTQRRAALATGSVYGGTSDVSSTTAQMSNAAAVTGLTSNGVGHRLVVTALIAERKRAIMIIVTGLSYIIGHSLNVYASIRSSFILPRPSGPLWYCLAFASMTLVRLSYATPFVFYYFFNTRFQNFANKTFGYLLSPVWAVLAKKE